MNISARFMLSFLPGVVLLASALAPAHGEPVKIYICAGQSNMVGPGSNGDLSAIDPGLLIPRDDVRVVFAGKKPGYLKPGFGWDSGNFGPELKFGHVVGDAVEHKVIIFKSCIGGTTLYNDWLPPSAASAQGRKTGYLYETMVTRFWNLVGHLKEVFPDLRTDGFEIAGMLWFQGENDSVDLTYSMAYQDNLLHLIRDVRADLDAPEMPFIIGEINDSGCWTHHQIIRQAQSYADANVPNTSMIMTSDLDPGYHYDSASIVTIGARFAAAALPYFEDGMEVHLALDGDYTNSGILGGAAVPSGDPKFVGPPQAKIGAGSLELDAGDAVTLVGYKGVTGIKNRTCAFWIRASGPGPVLSYGGAGPGERWEIGIQAAGVPYLDVGGGGALGAVHIMDGAWHHVAVVSRTKEVFEGGRLVRKQLTDDVEIYVNGVRDHGASHVSMEIDTVEGTDAAVGPGYTGLVDEVKIFDCAVDYGGEVNPKKEFTPPAPPGTCPELAASLIGYWRFDEGSGTMAMDTSTSGFHGELKGGASWQPGLMGSAVRLKANQFVQISGFQEPLGPGGRLEGLSVSLWVQTPYWFLEDVLKKGDGNNQGWVFRQFIDWAEFYAAFDDGGAPVQKSARSDWGDIAYPFGDGYEWQHVVFVYDGAARVLRIHVDGIQCGLSPVSCAGLDHIIPSKQPLIMGSNTWGGAFGALDEVAAWSRPLSKKEVKQLYNGGKGVVLATGGELSLMAGTAVIPAGTGGKVDLMLNTGVENGGRSYLILGSVSGILPGTPIPGGQAVLPLNWDTFTSIVLSAVNTPVFSDFMGTLDPAGCMKATLDTLGSVDPRFIGLTLYFAYALDDPWDEVSNPVSVVIGP